ncbi:MAG: WYL domain-containing protein [Actinobacteria bacterium]|jgi:proteasome accessory factor B|nr:WYL domain-containing protein [Actinomycetota bacterium]
MSSAKTERLVNLTMALLASRRFITKSEIFRRVAGYSGSQETKERMFERDKDDLRALGIEIEVGGHDPLFEDEPGYRILPEKYHLSVAELSSEDLGLIAVALDLWRGSSLQNESESILRRFSSLGITSQEPRGFTLTSVHLDEIGLSEITEALANRRAVRFTYTKSSNEAGSERKVNPLGLSAWRNSWYLLGEDLHKGEVRAFKLSRITSAIEPFGPSQAYEIPEDFDVRDYLIMHQRSDEKAIVKIRKEHGNTIRDLAEEITEIDDEWDRLKLPLDNLPTLVREVLWLAEDIQVEAPETLKEAVQSRLQELVQIYG